MGIEKRAVDGDGISHYIYKPFPIAVEEGNNGLFKLIVKRRDVPGDQEKPDPYSQDFPDHKSKLPLYTGVFGFSILMVGNNSWPLINICGGIPCQTKTPNRM